MQHAEARLKRLHAPWLHSHDTLEKAELRDGQQTCGCLAQLVGGLDYKGAAGEGCFGAGLTTLLCVWAEELT